MGRVAIEYTRRSVDAPVMGHCVMMRLGKTSLALMKLSGVSAFGSGPSTTRFRL